MLLGLPVATYRQTLGFRAKCEATRLFRNYCTWNMRWQLQKRRIRVPGLVPFYQESVVLLLGQDCCVMALVVQTNNNSIEQRALLN